MTVHIHIHSKDAGVFSRTSPQAFGALANSARAAARVEATRAQGNTFSVVKKQKNGKLASPDSFSVNLSKEQAEQRKAALERMNPGSEYVVQA